MDVALLISGGVDSSVALAQLVADGHRVRAFYLKIWLEDEMAHLGSCPWGDDVAHARSVCEKFGIPFEIIPMQQAYWERIVSYVIETIKIGHTPNPDILCNQHIKFGAFYEAIGKEFDAIATGHYAQARHKDGHSHLFCSPDLVKDQTYFLSRLSQEQLSRALFPIGHLTKEELRTEAARLNLPNATRKDSQGICFLGKIKFTDFIRYHVGEKPGELIEFETGKVIGKHPGFWFYTIGQRQGIGLSGGPWYVVAKETSHNRVFISRNYYTPDKERTECIIDNCNWFITTPVAHTHYTVKLRHGPRRHHATLSSLPDGKFRLKLTDENDQGIAPGQYAVVYEENECLGGGIIQEKA
ncbi:MAG: tRNA 2-thiouridine(34) synthase MnmA [Candidatus Babeliaceae bacterium]|nr:tRNA 2-thiouridine(34) synthase MnmA [Candidatus Babeliaceae bacterium]